MSEINRANISDMCDNCGKDIDCGTDYLSCSFDYYWICLQCAKDPKIVKECDSLDLPHQ